MSTQAMEPVLIPDGEGRHALAVTRALGRNGVPVVVGAAERWSLAGASRFANNAIFIPDPERAPEEYVDAVARAIDRYHIGVVMPASEVGSELLLSSVERLRPAVLPFGPLYAFEQLNDKSTLHRLASELDIPVPPSVVVERGRDVAGRLADIAALGEYPLVLKPYRSRIPVGGGYLRAQVRYARSKHELLTLAREEPVFRDHRFLVQKKVQGQGAGVFLLTDGCSARVCFGHRRLRERPPTGGESVLAEAVMPTESMLNAAQALLSTSGWYGVAMAEFKVCDGIPVLMEVNARFWGSLQLSIDAGVNFPLQLYRLATGRSPAAEQMIAGTRSRWFAGDLSSLYMTLRSDVPTVAKLRAAGVFLRTGVDPRVRPGIFHWDDPLPSAVEYLKYVMRFRRLRGPTALRHRPAHPRGGGLD